MKTSIGLHATMWGTLLALSWLLAPAGLPAQETEYHGAAALGLELRRMGPTQRVLMIGAHPDDENTALLARLALGDGADVAYLSLTRGEGGQNLIGPELQEALGLIRTEELLAARRLDGAQQFFTRAYDFGYSKTAEESFNHWPRDSLLSDVLEVVNRFRPDIIIATFSGTPADGHGQHQVSGILARDAFAASSSGEGPHHTVSLWRSLYRPSDDAEAQIETGTLDPLFGRSHYQIAMASRSRHRSQDMGTAQPIGPQRTSVVFVDGTVPDSTRLLSGVDSTLVLRARKASDPDIVKHLEAYERDITEVKASFNPLRPGDVVPALARAIGHLDAAGARAENASESLLLFYLLEERAQAERALTMATGIVLEVEADAQFAARGDDITLTLRLWNAGASPVTTLALEPELPAGWSTEALDGATTPELAAGAIVTRRYRVRVPRDATPSNPYFLRQPRQGDLYTWAHGDDTRALPFEPDPVRGGATVVVDGVPLTLDRAASFVTVDKSLGEVREPVRVVPEVSVALDPRTRVLPLPLRDADRMFTVTASIGLAMTDQSALGRLEVPDGWTTGDKEFRASPEPGTHEPLQFTYRVSPPAGLEEGRATITQHVRFADGRSFAEGYRVIDYPHTEPRLLFEDATTYVTAFPVEIAPDLEVGYIEGAGDDGALALEQMGATVQRLGVEDLANGDLGRFDAIVTGIRAYEVRQDLIEHNERLLDYARNGGTVVVQYNKYELPEGDFAPYPLTMSRPHGRVADETAPVRILDPEHPLLSGPNRITQADFEGWVQERGLYFAETWDDRYTPLLEMNDPGEAPLRGSLLVAELGDGVYVYTGLALFRQWSAGTPGAYRLMANLVSLGTRM